MAAFDAAGAPVPIEADGGHAAQMVQLLNTTFLLQALYAAVELGLADLVADGAKTPDALARDRCPRAVAPPPAADAGRQRGVPRG